MARIRIVRPNGAPAGFFHGVFLRYFAVSLFVGGIDTMAFLLGLTGADAIASVVSGLSSLASAIMFFDVFFIFGPARRTLHDRVADTIVVTM
jgi:uncharacterized RDD family membrane protein YckC